MSDTISFYNEEYYKKHRFVFEIEDRSDYRRILELLKPTSHNQVLEIGCGFGVLLTKIPSKNKIGIETNDYAVAECKKRGLDVIKADVEKGLSFDNSEFDIVIMNEVISHLKNPKKVLEECYRILSSGGKIILTAPVRSIFFHNISPNHISEMSVKELRELIEKSGFEIVSHEVNGLSFLYPLLENFLYRPFRFIRDNYQKKRDKKNAKKTVKQIDSCHGLMDRTLLKPLNIYRKHFLPLGLNQIILAKKNSLPL